MRGSARSRNISSSEEQEQRALIEWARLNERKYPELELLHHIPNGGKRGRAEAGRLKAMGVKAGMPDLALPVPRNGYNGLYIEMKSATGTTKRAQRRKIELLLLYGNHVQVCRSWTEAVEVIESYLSQPGQGVSPSAPRSAHDARG